MSRADRAWLALLMAAFLAWHVPLMYRIRAGQDEDFYAVPGMAILRGGLPTIPYIPSRDPESIYYFADQALYTLPPLGFYLAAGVHWVLGDGLGPARIASAISGMAAVLLVGGLAGRWSGSGRAGMLAASAYLFCRAFLFPATTARPDMAAIAFGLGAVWWVARDDRRRRDVVLGGVCSGLSLLCHPVGLVPTAQVGLALLAGPGTGRARLGRASAFAAASLAGFGLWLPMIALHPDLFRIQFGGNVLGRAGPGLGRTLRELPAVLAYQSGQFLDHVGPIQAALYAVGLLGVTALAARGEARMRRVVFHAAAGAMLLALFMGRHHIRNYYGYPAAMLSIPVGVLADLVADRIGRWAGRRLATAVVVSALLLALVPGSGLRVLSAHLGHWDDPVYRVEAFADAVVADIPPGALVAADGSLVLEVFERGRPVVEALVDPFFYDVRAEPFSFAVFGPIGLEQVRPEIEGLEFVRSYGDRGDPFGHYAELYRRSPEAASGRSQTDRASPGR
ncbi:glycosyltransferase family 39 protein [Tautonia sociabilis]|uniref:glycosyltransferase family 39 protein n=1 Tax=Tautonia sociabilis TaxID=2080755 RepID=UPI0013159ACB|nr:glycosyltransferase family 39 protein [Tautonia sociabilis]